MGLRILIVEDEQIIAADIEIKLGLLGHEVVGTAISGDEAIRMAADLRPELVMMDIQLQGRMNGVEAARAIEERAGARIIFVTAFPGIFPGLSGAPAVCVKKPFSGVQLEAALTAACNGRARSG